MEESTIASPRALRIEISEGIATLTLDRTDTLNALTLEAFRELRDLFRSFQAAPFGAHPEGHAAQAVRAVIITGAGAGVCSVSDIDELIGQVTRMGIADILAFVRLCGELIMAMRRLRKPIIAAVNGVAVGAGAALALASDIRIASDLARFGFIFPRMGLSGAGASDDHRAHRLGGVPFRMIAEGIVLEGPE